MDDDLPLFTDLYELTMGAVYFADDLNTPASFELFVRGMPPGRNFLIAAGLEQALAYLETLRLKPHHIDYLRSLGMFDEAFLQFLAELRFTGDVEAMPEGTVFFPDEPVLRVTAPRIEAQLVETYLLTCINYQSMVASKGARIAHACAGRPFVDFSPRRDHGAEAAVFAARAAHIAGAAGTSNVVAGMRFGIPTSGTMAHSFVMSYPDEVEAFCAYMRAFPNSSTMLIDTYDIEQGARNAIEAQRRMKGEGARIGSVRIDSGVFADEARRVREILDEAEMQDVRIFISGDLDEYAIDDLLQAEVPVDAFGVGTRLGVSSDAPYLSGVYKLVEDELGPRFKRSPGKTTLPGKKQVWRRSTNGAFSSDVVSIDGESVEDAEPLLRPALAGGKRVGPPETLDAIRERCAAQLSALPPGLRSLREEAAYPVYLSPGIIALRDELAARWDATER